MSDPIKPQQSARHIPSRARRRQDGRRVAPGHRLAREQQRLRKIRAHEIDVVQRRQHRAFLAVPAPDQIEQVDRCLGVDGVERLVEHDHARIL
jgi:hypothetical protein